MYSEGDPDLIAFSAMLDAVTTEELTRRDGVRDVIVGQEARAYDQLKAAEVLLEVQEGQVHGLCFVEFSNLQNYSPGL